jgi:hypothetical protein
MTIKRASFHEREDNIKKPKRPERKERNLKNALRSNDLDHLLEYTEDEFDDEEDYRWK